MSYVLLSLVSKTSQFLVFKSNELSNLCSTLNLQGSVFSIFQAWLPQNIIKINLEKKLADLLRGSQYNETMKFSDDALVYLLVVLVKLEVLGQSFCNLHPTKGSGSAISPIILT